MLYCNALFEVHGSIVIRIISWYVYCDTYHIGRQLPIPSSNSYSLFHSRSRGVRFTHLHTGRFPTNIQRKILLWRSRSWWEWGHISFWDRSSEQDTTKMLVCLLSLFYCQKVHCIRRLSSCYLIVEYCGLIFYVGIGNTWMLTCVIPTL